MGKELFETLPDVLDAKLLASALSISKAGAYQLLNRPDFPTLQVGGRKLVTKQKLALWMEQHTNKAKQAGAGKEKKADESMSRKRLSILIMMNRKPVFIQPARR